MSDMQQRSGGVEIDLAMLASVLDGDLKASGGGFLDLTNGMTFPGSILEDGGLEEDPEDDPSRWHFVPCRGSRDAWRDMRSFVDDEVVDPLTAVRLSDAITGRGPFRRFASVLQDYPDLRTMWFAYRDIRANERARQWLIDEGLVAPEADPGSGGTTTAHVPRTRQPPDFAAAHHGNRPRAPTGWGSPSA